MPVRNKTYKLLQEKHDVLNTVYQSALEATAHLQAENKQFEQIATDRQTQNNQLAKELANLHRKFVQLQEQCMMVTQDWTERSQENERLQQRLQLAEEERDLSIHSHNTLQQRLQAAHDLLTRADDIFRFIPVSRQSAANRTQIAQWRLDVIEAVNGVKASEEDHGGC